MKLLIVDKTTEAQALCAKRIKSFSRGDLEMLDLKVKLASDKDFAQRVADVDVIVVGSGLGDTAIAIARQASSLAPWAQMIMFVSDSAYGGGAFRLAHSAGVRMVFPDSATPLDFLQELVAINTEFRRDGRTHEGKIVLVTHAKGGVGATSIAAALADVCSEYGRRTMLWDLDVETRDLSRGLNAYGPEEKVVSAWMTGAQEIDRDTLRNALIPIGQDVGLLTTPERFADAMDLVCHTDGMAIAQRIAEVSRADNDVVLIDTAGRLGPATGALVRIADVVLVVIDDTVLGLTALDRFLSFVKSVVGNPDRITFVVNPASGALMSVQEMAAELEPAHKLGSAPWRLPAIPRDPKASLWPGRGKTLYSMGNKQIRQVLEQISRELGLLGDVSTGSIDNAGGALDESGEKTSMSAPRWFQRIFSKKSEGAHS
jgi:cellulose biosynthesis protein BcsQ